MRRILFPLTIALAGSCGPGGDLYSHEGSWRYSSTECGGEPVVLGGLVQTYTIGPETAITVTTTGVGASECTSQLAGIPVTSTEGSVRIHEGAAESVDCAPEICTHEVAGEQVRCPQDLPPAGVVYEVVEVGENEMVTTFGGCEQTWLRQ